jgi:glycerol kinase
MQFQSDILGVPVVIPEIDQTTALGAAYLAGVAVEAWTEEQTREMWREAKRFEPKMGDDERERLLSGWHDAVERSLGWAREHG